jgi:acetyl esterase/lipase
MLELDSEISASLAGFPFSAIDPDNLAEIRSLSIAPPTPLSDAVERTDYAVPGDPDVVIRVHRPRGIDRPLPCLYSIHGGGYVIGSFTMDDPRFDVWCPRFGCVGVSVEYRLSPETPYPGPLDDCYLGLQWVYDHHEELGVDPQQIGVAGVSAGGGLAAALALLARDRGELPLQFQLLDCPMIDDRQVTPSSRLDGLSIWSRGSNTFGWRSYLGDRYGTDQVPAYAAPARAEDLTGLPPAYVCVGAVDGFRDEDITYAMRLNQAGVPAELHVFPGAPHGVMMFTETAVAKRYTQTLDDWLGRQLSSGT